MQLASFKKTFKTVIISVFLLAILATTVFIGRKASTTFLAKAATCSAQKVNSLQVTANSAVVSWETNDISQGRIEYGINTGNLAFSAPEASSGKTHNVPLTLLTPNTIYYYLINIGNTRCDSSGQACTTACVPWSFTTGAITPQSQIEAVLPTAIPTTNVLPTSIPTSVPTTGVIVIPTGSTVSASLSTFCQQVSQHIRGSYDKQYDINNDGIINSLDIIACQKSGK